MNMTREEAIKALRIEGIEIGGKAKRLTEFMVALDVAQKALLPVNRERIEKVWKGEWNYSHTTEIDHFAIVKCSKCGHEAFATAIYAKDGNFCSFCGNAMTDEALEMVMERLEKIKWKN